MCNMKLFIQPRNGCLFVLLPGWRIMWMTRQSFLYWYFQRVSVAMLRESYISLTSGWGSWGIWQSSHNPVCLDLLNRLLSAGTCINNTSVMMFKKGSFEIGATIYPVAIKVLKSHRSLRFVHCSSLALNFRVFIWTFLSTTQSLEMLSGTAPSTAWSATCWGWWPAGRSCVTSGTCRPCIKRCVSSALKAWNLFSWRHCFSLKNFTLLGSKKPPWVEK